jgi:hypothetical protein
LHLIILARIETYECNFNLGVAINNERLTTLESRRALRAGSVYSGIKKKTFLFRIMKVDFKYMPSVDAECTRTNWKDFRGCFVCLREYCGLQDLERAFLDTLKELDPQNSELYTQAVEKILFAELNGPVITERVWEDVRDVVEQMEAEISCKVSFG